MQLEEANTDAGIATLLSCMRKKPSRANGVRRGAYCA